MACGVVARNSVPDADGAVSIDAELVGLDTFITEGFGAGGDFGAIHDVWWSN